MDTGVAKPFNKHKKWVDKDGQIIEEMQSYGMKVENNLVTHPQCCLVMVENGITNMMNDSAQGGVNYVWIRDMRLVDS